MGVIGSFQFKGGELQSYLPSVERSEFILNLRTELAFLQRNASILYARSIHWDLELPPCIESRVVYNTETVSSQSHLPTRGVKTSQK